VACSSIMWTKKASIYLENLFMSFESIMNFVKKIPSLVSLIASIVFNDSFGVENCIY